MLLRPYQNLIPHIRRNAVWTHEEMRIAGEETPPRGDVVQVFRRQDQAFAAHLDPGSTDRDALTHPFHERRARQPGLWIALSASDRLREGVREVCHEGLYRKVI